VASTELQQWEDGGAAPRRPAAVSAQAPGDPRWRQLVNYHLRAVRCAAIAEPVHHANATAWCVLELGRDELVTGRGDELAVSERLAVLRSKAVTGEAVYYGWPLVAMTDRPGRLRVAPLLMTEIKFPAEDGREFVVAVDDAPYLNPGLLTETFFPLDALAAVDACLVDDMPFGDADGVRSRVVDVLAILGFDASPLDPDALAGGWTNRPGVHNVAVAFRGRSQSATRTLRDELAELRERDDWQYTAARWLLDPPTSTRTDGARAAGARLELASVSGLGAGLPPVAVPSLQLNDAQEQASAAASTQLVTVVTGPPGTGKSRLVAAVVVNQWLAERSILVASTNNGAVDVAVRLCDAVDPALLVRTGKRELRDALPALLEQLADRGSTFGPSRPVIRRHLEVAAAGREVVHVRLAKRPRAGSHPVRLQPAGEQVLHGAASHDRDEVGDQPAVTAPPHGLAAQHRGARASGPAPASSSSIAVANSESRVQAAYARKEVLRSAVSGESDGSFRKPPSRRSHR